MIYSMKQRRTRGRRSQSRDHLTQLGLHWPLGPFPPFSTSSSKTHLAAARIEGPQLRPWRSKVWLGGAVGGSYSQAGGEEVLRVHGDCTHCTSRSSPI